LSNKVVINLAHGAGNPRNSEGAFITLANGRILFVYTYYYADSWSDIAQAKLVSRYSDDGGKTWSRNAQVVLENEATWNTMSVSLLRLGDGRIALFYLRTNSFHDCRLYLRTSADEAGSWSEPNLCIPAPGYFPVLNDRVIQLSSGRLLIPTAYHRPRLADHPDDWKAWDYRASTLFYYSDDDGETWQESQDWWGLPVKSRSGLQEPGAIELLSGEIYAWARTDTGRQWALRSKDQGRTWSPPEPTGFLSPNSSLSLKRIPETGDLLAIWNDRSRRWKLPAPVLTDKLSANSSWGRTPLVAAISSNEGKTWKKHKLIESDHRRGFCYASIHFDRDAVLLAYCFGGKGDGVLQNTRIRRISLDWFYQ